MTRSSRSFRLAIAAALFYSAPATADDIDLDYLGAIPAEYHGRWNSDPALCARFTGRYRLQIAANRLDVAGDRFKTEYIASQEDGGIFVSSRYVGPARPWDRSETYNLAEGGKVLINRHAGRVIRRYRCPR
ncbi:MAG TPA: hypothetical protein VFQ67_02925 [Allosphingosinicella sp.]|jgi:hypothetical protein|nr:hypothetical protein [Allosphingosinicella sp.]